MSKRKANRLINELSPYLKKHAHNPVDWWPWCDEAFAEAARLDKPVFLSVGYTTCHWCNVMEAESFDDPEAAALLNEAFVCIKVDREERPDIDNIYMAVCHLITGGGGWPLSIVMTPDKRPFFSGTYIPKESRGGGIGLMDLVPRLAALWANERGRVLESAGRITEALTMLDLRRAEGSSDVMDAAVAAQNALEEFAEFYDSANGGFGSAPKFPSPHTLIFLLHQHRRTGDDLALKMALRTLERMRLGGIYDHIGLGFHRYSTDARWHVPHFEKMLYDQAMLTLAYTGAHAATGNPLMRRTALETLSFALAEMQSPEGGFYSAWGADSEGEEGRFYVWRLEDFKAALADHDADALAHEFHVMADGNFIDPLSGGRTGDNVLYLKDIPPVADCARERALTALFETRQQREKPELDDKVLADGNGLMLAALARAGAAFGIRGFVDEARRCADFVLGQMRQDNGRLLHRWRAGEAAIEGHADDYAFMSWGLLELYMASLDKKYLDASIELNGHLVEGFLDITQGGLYFTRHGSTDLPVRKKEFYDGAVPSANAVFVHTCLRLSALIGLPELARPAELTLDGFAAKVLKAPTAYAHLVSGGLLMADSVPRVILSGPPDHPATREMLRALRTSLAPGLVYALAGHVEDIVGQEAGAKGTPYAEGTPYAKGTPTTRPDADAVPTGTPDTDGRPSAGGTPSAGSTPSAHVCRGRTCLPPVTSAEELIEALKAPRPSEA